MERLKKGYCFESADEGRFLIVGDAINQKDGEQVYLCQELSGAYRLMVWTGQAILKGGKSRQSSLWSKQTQTESWMKQSDQNQTVQSTEHEAAEFQNADELQSLMLHFLETSSCSEKLELLGLMKGKATESMLESMAISMDYELGGGSVEEKYYALERFLRTRNRYEGSRLR